MTHRSCPRLIAVAALCALGGGLSGCALWAQRDPSRYYTLAVVADAPARSASGVRVGLGPLAIPGYLSRLNLATRLDDTQIEYAEWDYWAEPLSKHLARTLGADLSRSLGGAHVIEFPWWPGTPMDVAVRVDVRAFEVDAAGTATLRADWALRNPASGQELYHGQSAIAEVAAGPEPAESVAALSRALAQLAAELAAAIVDTRAVTKGAVLSDHPALRNRA